MQFYSAAARKAEFRARPEVGEFDSTALRGLGFEYLGGGACGAAYLHKASNRVLKVGFSRADGTMGFMQWCAEYYRQHGKARKYFPEVYEFGYTSKGWFAVMERVTLPQEFFKNPDLDRESRLPLWALAEKQRAIQELQEAMTLCFKDVYGSVYSGDGAYVDLHEWNYGFRSNGELVMFDPLYKTHVQEYRPGRRVSTAKRYGPSSTRKFN